MAIENEKMKNYTEKKTPKKTAKHDSSDESSGPVVKKRKKSKSVKKEESVDESKSEIDNTTETVKGKSSVLSQAIIESDEDTEDNIEPVQSKIVESDEEMTDVKKSRAIIESDDD